jgi:hypothetical protein
MSVITAYKSDADGKIFEDKKKYQAHLRRLLPSRPEFIKLNLSDETEYWIMEKFAELIVKECAKRVDYWESRQGEHTDDILKHFGVEE